MTKTPKKKTPKKKSSGKKVWGTKHVLASPFAAALPKPIDGALEGVVKALEREFPKPPLEREPRPNKQSTDNQTESTRKTNRVKPQGLVLGLNEVTKKLERNELALAVVARDVLPVLISHIPVLCFLKNVKLVFVQNIGTELAVVFGSRTVIAFGLTKDAVERGSGDISSAASRLYNSVEKFAVKIRYPWLSAARGAGPVPQLPEPEMKPHPSIRKEEEAIIAGRKRYRTEKSAS